MNQLMLVFIAGVLTMSCQQAVKEADLLGIWMMDQVSIDEMKRGFVPQYLVFRNDNTFSVAAQSGDIAGWYGLSGDKIVFKSDDTRWYHDTWEVFCRDSILELSGKGNYQRTAAGRNDYHSLNTRLEFRKVDHISTNMEFVRALSGRWLLYKIYNETSIENPKETFITIDADERYQISVNGEIVESGKIYIDARHHQLSFEEQGTLWDVYFFGKELRMRNKSEKKQYALKRASL